MNRLPVVFLLAAVTALSQPRPTIDSMSPISAAAGSPNVVLTITGSNLTADSRVIWRYGGLNAVALASAFVPPNQLTAIVPSSLLTFAGDVTVAVTRQVDTQVLVSNTVTFTVGGGFTIQTPCPLPGAVVGTIYSATLLAQGGATPYFWSLAGGSLPVGLTLLATGTVIGTPSVPGESLFTLRAQDQIGRIASAACSLRVSATPESADLAITSINPTGVVAGAGSTTIEIRGVGFVNGAVAVWSVPPGQQTDLATTVLNPSTMTATIPATLLAGSGTFGIAVRQTVLTRQIFSNTQPFTVAGPLLLTSPCPLFEAAVDTDYSQRLVANGGFSPYSFSAGEGLPPGLRLAAEGLVSGRATEAGLFNFTLTVTDSRNNTVSRPCSMRVLGPLTVAPGEVNLSASSGGQPLVFDLSVITAAPGANVTAIPTTPSGGAWLRVNLTAPRTPALARLTADPSALAPGVYRGQVTISTDGATNRFISTAVTLTVGPAEAARITVVPAALRLAASRDFRTPPATAAVVLNSANVATSFTASTGAGWLSVSPASGTTSASSPARLIVRATPGLLGAGAYRTEVIIASGSIRTVLPVTLVIGQSPEVLTASKASFTYTAVQGGPLPRPKQVHVRPGANDFFWEAIVPSAGSGPQWTAEPPANASRPGSTTSTSIVPDTSGSQAGIHQSEVRLSAPAAGSVRYVSANTIVLPASAIPPPEPDTGAISLVTNAGANPATAQLQLRNVSRLPMAIDFQLNDDPQVFLVSSGAPRQTQPGQSRPIVIGANAATLNPGVYRATLAVQGSGSQVVQLIDLVLTVISAAPCTPARFDILPLSLPANFSAPGGFAVDVEVAVRDNCGNPLPSSGVVSASTGLRRDDHVTLTNTAEGRWSGSMLITQTSGGPLQVVLHATNGPVSSVHTVSGSINANPDQPVLFPDGIVSSASFLEGPVAPGGSVSAFGSGLAAATVSTSPPLQVRLGGAEMLVGEREAAFHYVSPGHLNAQLPYTVPGNGIEQVVVRTANRISNRIDIAVAVAQPAIFTILGESGAVADAANPVRAGQRITILCEGLGAVTANVDVGFPAPGPPASEPLIQPSVTIGGRPAVLGSSVLIPGLAGIYQVEATVPEGIAASDEVPVAVTSAGLSSNSFRIALR